MCERKSCEILVGESQGNRLLERLKSGRENNIKMDLKISCEDVKLIGVAQDRVQLRALEM
jgi:hypothetical protein